MPPLDTCVERLWLVNHAPAYSKERIAASGTIDLGIKSRKTRAIKTLFRSSPIQGDLWLLEFSYAELAEYYPGINFPPQQRVAFAAELYDAHTDPVSPQEFLQALPIVNSMNRLSVPPLRARTPVVLRTRP